MKYLSIKELINEAKKSDLRISELVKTSQSKEHNVSVDELCAKMKKTYEVMKESIETGLSKKSNLKIEQNDASKIYKKYVDDGKSIFGSKVGQAVAMAMAVSEVNAGMGKIVAAPTAGSCGIIPAAIVTIKNIYGISEEKVIDSLFTASAIGMVISNVMDIAGASGGCQAECGVAQSMAAAAIVDMLDGDYEQIANAVAISLKNIEGLVCDPVAGLVECPCIKRNASGVINAILAADMALAGVVSIIPVDEVIQSVKQVGDIMDDRLKETAMGGLAATETGKVIMK
ncbi:MAG: L-serine ammonia-lyase, iron-sulfur-dependent, subunit alpha [Lachnospiraceae bacterium]|nr:L-serine ammonia-lyase, iron-sulfur-dependent, subunit alpha [Lachnospiraceae bacterium]